MGVVLIIIIAIVIFVVYSNNKEKERQRLQRITDAANIRKNYKEGCDEYLRLKRKKDFPYGGYSSYFYSSYYTYLSDDEALSHKSEIIKLHNEVIARYRVAARIDEQFETEQKTFNDKCYALSKKHLIYEGRYHYDIEWHKNKTNGGWSKEKFMVWQFFPYSLCLNQELDYTYCLSPKTNADNLLEFKEKTRYWNQPVYDRINTFISAIAQSSSRPLIIAFVDTKDGWNKDALDYHLKNIKRDIPNTIISPLSQLKTNITGIGNQLEHVIVVDVYTENAQLTSICENIEKQFSPSHTAISYISMMKCYDSDEMVSILKQEEEKEKQRRLHEQAESIKQTNPNGYERWQFSLELNGFKGEIKDQMINDSKDTIIKHQREYGEESRRENERKEKLESEYNRIKIKYPIGTEYYEKYESRYGKTKQELVVENEEGVAKYNVIYAKYLELQRKYPIGLPAYEKYNSYDDGKNSAGPTIEEIVECEDEIREFEQKETNRLKQLRDSLPTKVKNWDKLQNGLPYSYLIRYYPTTCEFEATDDEWDDRYIVWNFKNDPTKVSSDDHEASMMWVVQNVKDKLLETFGKESLKYLTLVCIPASSKTNTERRYKDFSSRLCGETGMTNSYPYVNITQDGTPKHLGGTRKPVVSYDEDFFKNKNVIIFDDVITSGGSMLRMKEKLVRMGATVIAGISIGKTFHHRPEDQNVNTRRSSIFDDDLPF